MSAEQFSSGARGSGRASPRGGARPEPRPPVPKKADITLLRACRASHRTLPLAKGELEGVLVRAARVARRPPSIPPPRGGEADNVRRSYKAISQVGESVCLGSEPE